MENLFEKLRKLNLPKGKYAIFGSGPLSIRGIRQPHDLDIIVYQEIYDHYKQNSEWREKECKDSLYLSRNDELELWKDWGPGEWDIKELIKNAEIINVLPFVRLGEVLKWKKICGRSKDLRDIVLIEEFLKKESPNKNLGQ